MTMFYPGRTCNFLPAPLSCGTPFFFARTARALGVSPYGSPHSLLYVFRGMSVHILWYMKTPFLHSVIAVVSVTQQRLFTLGQLPSLLFY